MTETIIIALSILLLIAYIFDITSAKTKIPSVLLLLFLGWALRQLTIFLELDVPDLSNLLPFLGTIGLVLIVLEGGLELEIHRSKSKMIKKSLIMAIIPMVVSAILFSVLISYFSDSNFQNSMLNAIPLCIISSAIAIPSVKNLCSFNKEFVIYESSFSDILGVLFFNFVLFNSSFNLLTIGLFGLQLFLSAIASFIVTVGLVLLLNKITHQIKFIPIFLIVVLIFSVAEHFHLPALIFILFFGLFLGNIDKLSYVRWFEKLKLKEIVKESHRFKDITFEIAFLVRTMFFILFGYLIKNVEVFNLNTLPLALGIVAAIFLIRAIMLGINNLALSPLLFMAPRGLITILLFLSIAPENQIWLVNKSLIIQVIILTAIAIMIGLMTNKGEEAMVKTAILPDKDVPENSQEDNYVEFQPIPKQ